MSQSLTSTNQRNRMPQRCRTARAFRSIWTLISPWSGREFAGLSVALEAARLGASVAVLEGRHIGWNASGPSAGNCDAGLCTSDRRA